ncbi:amidohydrolase [Halalkalibacter kiskunsagensis]|uniref:Amidohydrolase n=1 Tax=Halalkalibacter kiskunsagensis TaxID=1548599 RepID=A0ABV6KAQ1_9BACI
MKKLFYNGFIYTSNPNQPHAEAMIVEAGKIIWIGNQAEIKEGMSDAEGIDLQGRRVLPGIIDAHMHPVMLADVDQQIYCGPPKVHSIFEMQGEIQKKYDELSAQVHNTWIRGWGYDEVKLTEQRSPTRWDLDQVAPDVPVILTRTCSHIIVVNSVALQLAGINEKTVSPTGGEIDVNAKGELTGIFKEKAREFIYSVIPEPTIDEQAQRLATFSEKLFTQGITSTTELMATSLSTNFYDLFMKAYTFGYKQRTVLYYLWEEISRSEEVLATHKLNRNSFLHIGGIKLFADGSISGKTAWVDSPYKNERENIGLSTTTSEELVDAAKVAKKHDIQLVVHAMGERAIEQIVDTFHRQHNWIKDAPSIRIEHAALPKKETLLKAIEIGISFVTQPIFLFAEINSYLTNLGSERTNQSYPLKTMIQLGAKVAISSDAPATSWADTSNPFIGIKAAVTRTAYTGQTYNLSECVTVEEAIDLYTRHAQEIARIANVGQLKVGYCADFIILDRDILNMDVNEIDQINVLHTYLDGQLVHST